MRALLVDPARPGELRFDADCPTPAPRPGELLLRVRLAGICATDLEILRGYMGFAGVPGHEFVATVDDGPDELRGRRVVAEINCACGECALCRTGLKTHCPQRTVIGIVGRGGAMAEFLCAPRENCHVVPDTLSDQQAVFVEPLAAALQVVLLEPIEPHTRVAVLGTGRLGLLVAQVAARSTRQLLVIGRNPRTLDLVRSWGLMAVSLEQAPHGREFDMVIECTGAPRGLELALRLCLPRGTVVLKSTYADPRPLDLAPIVIHELRVVGNRCGPFDEALRWLAEQRVHVDELVSGVFPLERGVEAFAAAGDPANVKILLQTTPA